MACGMQLPTWSGHQWRLIQHFLQMTLLLALLCPPTEPVPWDNDFSSGPGEVRTIENEQMIPAGRTRMRASVCNSVYAEQYLGSWNTSNLIRINYIICTYK